jgi:desulfoferrodoxin-like iron-binding protein
MKYNDGEILKCEICGNVVEVKEVGPGTIICCGQPMTKIER